jgi:hypothetical protein
MGKVRRLIYLATRTDFPRRLGAAILFAVGVVSAVFGILNWHLSWGYAAALLAFTALIGAVVVLRQLEEPVVPVDDVLLDPIVSGTRMRLRCPCDEHLTTSAKELAGHYFDARLNIDPAVYDQLHLKNRLILCCLTTRGGDVLGYFDAIPLDDAFGEAFFRGYLDETQITHEVVLSRERMRSCKYLYLAGIAVWNSNTPEGKRNARILVWAYLRYLEKYYAAAAPLAFAVATTKAGEVLAERIGMTLHREVHNANAKYKMYSSRLTRENLEAALSLVRDCSDSCMLDWQVDRPGETKSRLRASGRKRTKAGLQLTTRSASETKKRESQ